MTTPIYYYSAQTEGFYLEGVHDEIPEDAVPITEQAWRELVSNLAQGVPVNPADLESPPTDIPEGAPEEAPEEGTPGPQGTV